MLFTVFKFINNTELKLPETTYVLRPYIGNLVQVLAKNHLGELEDTGIILNANEILSIIDE
jgi:hypothetical protein